MEQTLREIADGLYAHSGLASNEYLVPMMGLLFLRHAPNLSIQGGGGNRNRSSHRQETETPTGHGGFVKRGQYGVPPDEAMARIAGTNRARQDEL
jgi:hypothetical protein